MEWQRLGADLMAAQVPPPPPGFVLQGAAPQAAPPRRQQRAPVAQFQGELPTDVNAVFPALVAQESGGRAGVLGPQTRYGQAIGRTQMLPATAREMAQRVGVPFDEGMLRGTTPEAAAYQDRLGLEYLKQGFEQTGNMRDALRYYHGGPDRRLWGPKTQAYSEEVLARLGGGQELPSVNPTSAAIPAAGNVPPPPPGFEIVDAPQTAAPIEVEIGSGVRNVDGRAILDGKDMGPFAEYEANQLRSQSDRQARLARQADPAYQEAYARAQGGSAAVPERLRAVLQGQSLGFGDEILGAAEYGIQGLENIGRRATGQPIERSAALASQAARDSERDAQAAYARENPIENFALQLAGGVLTPGMGAAGQYVQGARGAERLRRAGQVGFGTGAVAGAGYAEGDLGERVDDAAMGAVAGAGAGVIGQGALDRIGRAGQGGGAARRLSRQGVRLLPGQMVAETPVIGPMIRNAEDVAAGFNPLVSGVRRAQNEDVVRVAGQEALDTIGERLPRDARTGYQVSQNVRRALGNRYDEVTSRVTAQADQPMLTDLQDMISRASQTLDDGNLNRLNRIINDKVINEFDANGTLTGGNFKRIETALREQSERASRPTSTLADNDLAEFLDESRDIVRNLIARQYPEEAANIQSLNRGWAISKRIERAVSGSAGFAREGTPTPGELSQTVANMSSSGQIADERALLQGLATDARAVLPATVGDTGSGQKATLGVLAAGGGAAISPALAPLIAAGVVVYSPIGIGLLNAVYRATDSQAANVVVRQLADQARRNPALIPYYEDALQHVLRLGQTDTQASRPSQSPQPTPIPVQ